MVATASASAVGSGVASANSTAMGNGGGAATATSTSSGPSGQTVVASATSAVGSGPASALTQTTFGGSVSLPNAINAGQSFSAVNAFAAGPLTLALGTMGAGGIGNSLAYQQSADFTFNSTGVPFLLALTGSSSVGSGFDSALFQVFDNGNLLIDQSFADLGSAEAFFSNKLLDICLGAGFNDLRLSFRL